MRFTRRNVMAAGGTLFATVASAKFALAQQVAAPKSPADVPGVPPHTVMTKEYLKMVGRIAYIWGWPLVNNANRAHAVASLPGSRQDWECDSCVAARVCFDVDRLHLSGR